MKLALAQTHPTPDHAHNLERQLHWSKKAAEDGASVIVFPELSLTSYESAQAAEWAMELSHPSLESLRKASQDLNIIIATGASLREGDEVFIGMPIFFPDGSTEVHNKNLIHASEEPFFSAGEDDVHWMVEGHVFTPGICYESTLDEYANKIAEFGTDILLVSNAKTEESTNRSNEAYKRFSEEFGFVVAVSNSVGMQNGEHCNGHSVVWIDGQKVNELNEEEGILLIEL